MIEHLTIQANGAAFHVARIGQGRPLLLLQAGRRATTASVLAPWHRRAATNAKRLRKK